MLTIPNVRGVIFDVDETLLDNRVSEQNKQTLHEQARLQALQEAGQRHNLPELLSITPEQNLADFHDAAVHSLEGAIWHALFRVGLVSADVVEPTNKLLQEITTRKNELYTALLHTNGKPVLGAVEFVRWLGDQGHANHMAIASTATRQDIYIFLKAVGLASYFPDERIIAKDTVTHTKPHPEAFDKAFLSLELPEDSRDQVLAFEDHPRGIMSAKVAGLYACGITTVFSKTELASLEVAPDLIADSFHEFRELLTSA